MNIQNINNKEVKKQTIKMLEALLDKVKSNDTVIFNIQETTDDFRTPNDKLGIYEFIDTGLRTLSINYQVKKQ